MQTIIMDKDRLIEVRHTSGDVLRIRIRDTTEQYAVCLDSTSRNFHATVPKSVEYSDSSPDAIC